MIDFDKHDDVMEARRIAQEIEIDRREKMRECLRFVTDPEGQWEESIIKKFDEYKRPKYTFDLTSTIVNKYYGEMTQNDFNICVTPMGSGASKETAKLIAGLIKNTESISRATNVYSMSARMQMITGFDCMEIEQDWASPDSFDQDLFIRHISDSLNRVWFLGNYQERTCEDADGVIVEHLVSTDEYKNRFDIDEKNPPQSLGDNQFRDYKFYKRTGIRIAKLIFKSKIIETIYKTADGIILDEKGFSSSGLDIKNVKSRQRESYKICVRWFDQNRWLNESQDTVFNYLSVVPVLPNFLIVDDKPLSKGVVEPLMDWQRVRNYTGSAFVEETALAPKDIIMMTRAQLAGNEKDVGRLNVAGRPILTYSVDPDAATPPYKPGAYQANQALASIFTMTEQGIQSSAGMFAAGLGDNPGLQSGIAIEKLDNNSNLGSIEYFKAEEVALGHIGKILTSAYPKVYDSEQEKRIINDDGSYDIVKINEVGLNGEIINDLSKGIYDTYCDIGKAFRNRQEQAAEQFVKLGQIDPILVQENEDILLNSIDSPGMDIAAARARSRLLRSGSIPESQWTDEEKEQAAQAAQAAANAPPPPDPNMIIAQAELEKAHAKTSELQIKSIKLQQDQQEIEFDQQKQKISAMQDQRKNSVDEQLKITQMLNTMADTLQKIGASMGVGAISSSDAESAYDNQAKQIEQVQNSI